MGIIRKLTGRAAILAAAIAVSAAIPMVVSAENASILLNGSFESYVAGNNDAFTNTQLHAGMSATRHPNNWSYTSGAGLCASGDDPFLGGGDVPDGSIAVYLQNSGSISQPVTVTDAGTYEVSFRYASRGGAHVNGYIYVKIVDSGNVETTIASIDCPVTAFRTAYAKTYLAAGTYTLKLEHNKGSSSSSGDSILDRVEMKLMDNLISNGSFEDYRNENNDFNTYKRFVAGTFVPEAWGYAGNCVLAKDTFLTAPPDGEVGVALRDNAVLSQTFIATVTGVHGICFRYAGRGGSYVNGRIHVKVDDVSLGYVDCPDNVFRTACFKTNLVAGTEHTLSLVHDRSSGANADSSVDFIHVVASTNLILNGGFDIGPLLGSVNGGAYLQANNAAYGNPFWTESGSMGRMGLAISGSTWINAALDVGTYAMYMQTLSGYAGNTVLQDFSVDEPGIYSLSFVHAKRANGVNPVTKVSIYKGIGTGGEVVYENEVASQYTDVFESFAAEVKLKEAGDYTLVFRRDATTDNIAAILDNVSLTYSGKIRKGLSIIIR